MNLEELARALVSHYERNGGCGFCGGLPHSTTCFVGRFKAALADARGGQTWQPIETAPRDGRVVRLRVYGCGDYTGFWNGQGWMTQPWAWHARPSHWTAPSGPEVRDDDMGNETAGRARCLVERLP